MVNSLKITGAAHARLRKKHRLDLKGRVLDSIPTRGNIFVAVYFLFFCFLAVRPSDVNIANLVYL